MNATRGNTFGAPWGRLVKVITGLVALWFLGMVALGVTFPARIPAFVRLILILAPLCVVAGAAVFVVRGYTIGNGEIEIERLGWSTHVDLRSLKSATLEPRAMRWSIRLAGNAGLFAFVGWFWNRKLRRYRAFATDLRRSVVLRFANPNRTVVITPDEPERFVEKIRSRSYGQ